MGNGAINFFNDALDDVLLPDQVPSFEGGMFSNVRANLLQENQSKLLQNCDVDKLGKLRTRRGTLRLGTGPPGGGAAVACQGLTYYQTADYNYVVAAQNRKIWAWNESSGTWFQIATGGVSDDDEMLIYRVGLINNASGYPPGTTVLTVDGITGFVAAGEKLYFSNNLRSDWYEYTIAGVSPAAPAATTQIILEEPGLVFDVKDNWKIIVARPARINHAGGYPGGYANGDGSIVIDEYDGAVNSGETFVIKSESVRHVIDTHTETGGNTTALTGGWSVPLQPDFLAADATRPIIFAQGNDLLFISDGTGPIYAWNGQNTSKLSSNNALDYLTGSVLHRAETTPPAGCGVLVWFTNRLIASGIASEPDAIYFSDFFDPTSWDHNYQKVRIGGGESDPITGLMPWTDYNMLVFKRNSIYIINLDPSQNPFPDDPTLLVASFGVKQIHKRIGCPAPLTAVQVGGSSSSPGSDIFFLDGDKKVHSVRRVLAAETQQEVGQAISLPIQDQFDTINIAYIDRCTAMYHNEHYIIGIPSLSELNNTRPNMVAVYNMLTQSWCGMWTWKPTCFAVRTDVGAFSKLIFGDVNGNVQQWYDDLSLSEETLAAYEDFGTSIATLITTRGITFGDAYSFKTGLNVEFEFDESIADQMVGKVILDKVVHPTRLTVNPFSTLSAPQVKIPITIPFTLNTSPGMLRKAFDLQRYGTWRELQFQISCPNDKVALRSIRVTGFMDTVRLQTIPLTGRLE